MNQQKMRSHIMRAVLARLDLDPARRAEALRDFLALSLPGMDETAVKARLTQKGVCNHDGRDK